MSMQCEATPIQRASHAARRERLQRMAARAVFDDGIDLKRKKSGTVEVAPVVTVAPLRHLKLITANRAKFWPTARTSHEFWPVDETPQRPSIERIQREVAAHYKMTRAELLSRRRGAKIVFARQVAVYLSKTFTLRSLPEIGRRFNGRDHTTILHSIRKIARLLTLDDQQPLKDAIAQIRSLNGWGM